MKKWDLFSSKKSLLRFFFFLGIVALLSLSDEKSFAATSPEYNFFNTSPVGSSGGFAVPASCPSDLHDDTAPFYGQTCYSPRCNFTGTIQCDNSCSAVDPANEGQPCTSPANNCGQTVGGTYTCSGTCTASSAPADYPGVGSACQSAPNSVGQTSTGVGTCPGAGCGGTDCSACPPPNPPSCTTTNGGWCDSDHSYSWTCYNGAGCPASPGAGWVDVGGGCWNKDNGMTPACAVCGNGIVGANEQCDQGGSNGACPASCSSSCTNNSCGGGPIAGACAAAHFGCSTGTPINTGNNGSQWTWQCQGSNGGSTASCSEPSSGPIDPACGSANGQSYPAFNFPAQGPQGLCNPGNAWGFGGNGPWFWNCDGTNGSTVTVSCSANAIACGNGIIESGEQCDPGAANLGACPKACSATCQNNVCGGGPVCGNGVVEAGESCDQGAANGSCPAACSATCTLNSCGGGGPVCGNGIVEAGEGCDNGASAGGNGACPLACSATCQPNVCGGGVCGDGNLDATEQCDAGAGNVGSCSVTGQCLAGACTVCIVLPPPPSLYICPSSATIGVGGTVQLNAYYDRRTCSSPTNIVTSSLQTNWSSNSPAIATVNNGLFKGRVTGVATGSTRARVTYQANAATANINVTCLPVSNCNPATQATLCQSDSYNTTDSCGNAETCFGTRVCDFNWKEVAP